MGQYYRIAIKEKPFESAVGENIIINDRKVNEIDYISAKLLEHGWMECVISRVVAHKMYKNPIRLAWIGDYASKHDIECATEKELNYEMVWGDSVNLSHTFDYYDVFDHKGKYLVNHSRKMYISFDDWCQLNYSEVFESALAPFIMLTAIGGEGEEYYYGYNKIMIGEWAWDILSIEDERPNSEFDEILFKCGCEK
jgi:hypothetical protein